MSEPELLLTPGYRQRLVEHLLRLEAEAAVAEHADRLRPPTLLSVAQVAELLGTCRGLVQQAVHDGSLPSVRGGGRILIPRGRLLAWLEVTEAEGEPALSVDSPHPQCGHPGGHLPWRESYGGGVDSAVPLSDLWSDS